MKNVAVRRRVVFDRVCIVPERGLTRTRRRGGGVPRLTRRQGPCLGIDAPGTFAWNLQPHCEHDTGRDDGMFRLRTALHYSREFMFNLFISKCQATRGIATIDFVQYIHCSLLLPSFRRRARPPLGLVYRSVTRVVPTLGSEAGCVAEVVNPSKQNLQHAISNAGRVSRQLMSCKVGCIECQPTLGRPLPLDACACKGATIVLRMVRGVQWSARVLPQTLMPVPRHVLDSKERPVGGKQEVEIARANQSVIGVLNHTCKSPVNGRTWRHVRPTTGAVAENVYVGALFPVRADDCMKRFLDVCTVEVDFGPGGLVVTAVDYAELTVGVGACFGDVVDVEARIDLKNGRVEVVELIAAVIIRKRWARKNRERLLGCRELDRSTTIQKARHWTVHSYLEVCVQVGGVVASILHLPHLIEERFVEVYQILPVFDIWETDNFNEIS